MRIRNLKTGVMLTYFLLLLCLLPKALNVSLHIVVLVPQELSERQELLENALKLEENKDVQFVASMIVITNNSSDIINYLCHEIQQRNPHLVLSFLKRTDAYFASLISGYVKIPVLGMTGSYTDDAAQEVNPFYISLDASATNLADSTYSFLNTSKWYNATLLTDYNVFSLSIANRLKSLTSSQNRLKVTYLRTDDSQRLFDQLSALRNSEVRVIILSCDRFNAYKVFQEASKLDMLDGQWIWILLEHSITYNQLYPPGLLAIKLRRREIEDNIFKMIANLLTTAFRNVDIASLYKRFKNSTTEINCNELFSDERKKFSSILFGIIKGNLQNRKKNLERGKKKNWISPVFDILNLVSSNETLKWKTVGNISGHIVNLETIVWLSESTTGPSPVARYRYRIVTGYAPPFVKQSTRIENGSCLQGVPCLHVNTKDKEEIVKIFADFSAGRKKSNEYNVTCCAGIAIDLLTSISRDLFFDYDLYAVADGFFGTYRSKMWNGITADLISGAAHLTFSAYSMTSERSSVVDYSVPYFHSGVSCLTYTKQNDVPLSAFLIPFSVQLWIAIFASLTTTALAAALYEWFSPFGLNPWGRQRTKNFTIASALWVMWSLLFSHLVAFKAPKSWPNKVLINLWGCFSVIFLASYTANIAALFAGIFSQVRVDDFHDAILLSQKTGTAKGSSAESFVHTENSQLWKHIQNYGVDNLEDGLQKLRKGELDVLIGDTAVLNYFRGNDPGCGLHLLGDSIFDDAYAVGMQKDFPLKDSISKLILKYNEFGYLDQLQKKWYGRVPCFEDSVHRLNKPLPLSIQALAGVFIMLGIGILVGIVILVLEHLVFKYALPALRKKPKDCFWRSPNLMFFSQKLYRFINTVELVSPHHSAKEIVTNLREGQIASLFQKSVKKKIKEEARRRKSKSQFFEMIQEIRKVAKQQNDTKTPNSDEVEVRLTSPSEQDTDDGIEQVIVHSEENFDKSRYRKHADDPRRIIPLKHEPYSDDSVNVRTKLIESYQSDSELSIVSTCPTTSSLSSVSMDHHGYSVIISLSLNDLTKIPKDCNGAPLKSSKQRVWSFDDLTFLKRGLDSENEQNEQKSSNDYLEEYPIRRYDELRLYSMTKEDIIRLWQTSERTLMNRLQEALREKKSLEEKLAFIQKTLIKSP
ncbi:glutamate receptor ionotropic, NMDA 3A-like [Centruroides sculpturatus]|uniref:glutamate receptor ionotropic, NMDA 3A-like n=2 Tax=Centruroides sculpturatus TaxID=218467 RepID=UPI000C6E4059|nr:glutamate receptor ionotropic, NMDA 3A-like [Centruroides sculpturatus]